MTCPQCGTEMHFLFFGGHPYDIIWCPLCGYMERLVLDVYSD
jgi:Zn ribbon nucleic-acid-binding protein